MLMIDRFSWLNPKLGLAVAILSAALGTGKSYAAFSYAGCTDLAATDFREVVLVGRTSPVNGLTPLAVDANMIEPVGMYVHSDGKVFWAERINIGNSGAQTGIGRVKMFDPSNNTVTTVLTLNVAAGVATGQNGNAELGLRFATLHPNFATNRWAYVYYMPRTSATARGVDTMVLSRFTVQANWTFDVTSEKKLLRMPWTPGICCHQGGAMDWDAQDNLYVTTGNNAENSDGFGPMVSTLFGANGDNKDRATQDNQARAANTMDWRGKTLRIHPDNSALGYSIPAGNMRSVFFTLGNAAWLAGQDTTKILPEIYSFGDRNPYSISVDKTNGWVTTGVVGPDAGSFDATRGPAGNDEFNLNTRPSFNGWPYFVGPNRGYNMWNGTNGYTLPPQNPDSVFNNSPNNTGVLHLPRAIPCIIPESKQGSLNTGLLAPFGTTGGTAATTGPIYHYNGASASTVKFPPHLDGKWIIAESSRNRIFVATVNGTGTTLTDLQEIPGDLTVFRPSGSFGVIDMKMGPEGALYIAHYSAGFFASSGTTRISRIEYTGTCRPSTPVFHAQKPRTEFHASLSDRLFWPEGMYSAEVFSLQGRLLWSAKRAGSETAREIPANVRSGLFRVRFSP